MPGTFLGEIFSSRRSRNNQFISQPNFGRMPFNPSGKESWCNINGQEREIYLTTGPLKIVINRLSMMFANGIWEHHDSKGELIPFEKSPELQRLERPNIFQSRNEFLFQWFAQRCVYGKIYQYQHKGSALQTVPSAIWNLSPSRVVVNRTGQIWTAEKIEDIISSYTFKNGNGIIDTQFKTDDIIQFSMPDCDDPIMSESPLISIRMEISNIRAAMGFRNVILTKKGAIGAWSSMAKDITGSISLTPDEETKMIREMQQMYGIGDEQLAFMISSKELKWTPAVFPTKDLMLFEEIDADKRAIIDLFGGNDNMFSRPSSGKGDTFTNVEAGEKICYQDTMIPIGQDFSCALSDRWGLTNKGQKLVLNFDHLSVLQQDEKKKAEVANIKAGAYQILTMNGFNKQEAAEAVGLEEPLKERPVEVVTQPAK